LPASPEIEEKDIPVFTLLEFPDFMQFRIRKPIDDAVDWMQVNLYDINDTGIGTRSFSDFLTLYMVIPLRVLMTDNLPWIVMMLIFSVLAYLVSDWKLALFTFFAMLLIGGLGMWENAMDTLSQVIVAVILSIVIGIPLGVWSARSDLVESILKAFLDFLQTIPPFVYLLPVIMLFTIGRIPGIIASVLYALPPAVRLTNLGIRQVDKAIVEAADAFGSTSWQTLFKVQLPLALPSIMLGINQTIMMVLAMVIIAGLIGGGGLGFEVVAGLSQNELGRGVEAGTAIVLLAIVLDRITQGIAIKQSKRVHIRV
jgi:glycine betaine/proline transport system permease protein